MLTKKCSMWHLIAGIIMLVLGILVWANPLSSLYAIAIYVGAALFILGCGYVASSFSASSPWYMVIGLLDIFIGLIFLTNLGLTVQTLPIFFALWFLATGIMQLYGSYESYKLSLPWGWNLFSGILGIVIAYLVLGNQAFGDFALVILVGLYLAAYGAISIAEYFYLRTFCKAHEQRT
ncbi:MAG: DUF308 domain-containing protein [Alphaproteobacteria bacterium]|nr:DUF308 domain-containing protein [Alphaproteobacteria bacterium]MBR1756859.1 DUF308 domain-containing protein [Alphaproteobacteria bacterium]